MKKLRFHVEQTDHCQEKETVSLCVIICPRPFFPTLILKLLTWNPTNIWHENIYDIHHSFKRTKVVSHVGNIWIRPWANFPHYMDPTLYFTVGKRNYFTGYGILLHELPAVAVLFTQSNNNEGTMKNSILHEMFCKSLFRNSRLIVK